MSIQFSFFVEELDDFHTIAGFQSESKIYVLNYLFKISLHISHPMCITVCFVARYLEQIC